jgi:hypothetical protein
MICPSNNISKGNNVTQENVPTAKAGRPPGSPNKSKSAALLDRLLSSNKKEIKEILQAAIDLAHKNEPWAVQAILERVWPKPAGRTVTFAMPRLTSAADCAMCLDALLQAAAIGSITPAECAQLSTVVSRTGEALAAKSIEDRIDRLEAQQSGKELTFRRVS